MALRIKSTRSSLISLPQLFHISFNSKLEGEWDPEFNQKDDPSAPPVDPNAEVFPYPEPSLGRISLAPSIEQCFLGVYGNTAKFFTEKKYPHMNFYVYAPRYEGAERVVTPKTLTDDRLVWDAHVTKEHLILDTVFMRLIGEVMIKNTNKNPIIRTHPFNDPREPMFDVGPEKPVVTWLEHF